MYIIMYANPINGIPFIQLPGELTDLVESDINHTDMHACLSAHPHNHTHTCVCAHTRTRTHICTYADELEDTCTKMHVEKA